MKYNIYKKKELDEQELHNTIRSNFNNLELSNKPDIVFTFGGDGTFLDGLKKFGVDPIYIPINQGTLGFYTSWLIDEISCIEEELKQPEIVYANMLNVSFVKNNIKCEHFCLNEATLMNPMSTQIVDIFIDDFHLETFRGTGLCVSTPTGSTAYNKSLGGAIISSKKSLFQMTKMAAINNVKYRSIENPMIFGEGETLCFVANGEDFKYTLLTIDRQTYSLEHIDKVEICLSSDKLKILVRKDNNFYQRVKNAFV